ncbi:MULTISPECIES: HlyD family secretion protein [Olivibacter]|jgi:HlyD family secretion protein|uniref:HlyD family secretion protein n=2 Tax=Olivibacter TaxID=376469 RepID=A0ABV6HME9_9SPHI|nr:MULTISPECIES: HlyD family efflux transporter periplasmic adaptor subunit [Olivibacter]MCL4640592.1 HlyD family efflux transporter periplasmic adaptor subunit [Olivibacter sp. UJ_SKK_5.1]MDM8175814.1 HlyD family efflux transporter periplasmic adaptor subunit [Olivibacter sp. 47]MDX3914420.1 HlyD family efflux transporter periplasmic adaptor subunit [Pseudosphingobacterium sp.]QEL02542.1 HlyD family efflux transporter periplasmic adaptor subunit [Olivibacter sp. LS-1]
MKTVILYTNLLAFSIVSCKTNDINYDASGAFETVETIVPAEANGIIRELLLEEGQTIPAGKVIGYIDTLQLFLKKKQLEAQAGAILSKRPNIATEIAALQEELRYAKNEQERLTNLVKADAATPKELDAATAQVNIIRKRIEGQQSSLGIASVSLQEETAPLHAQIEQLDDQLRKSKIVNPVTGTVLAKYVEANEMATIGKPLYRIANTKKMILRAYITGEKFADVKIGQRVRVQVDKGKAAFKDYPGVVEWISDQAEFTPKTIQTKDERANLVYAMKVKVENDGYLKIGMYGQVILATQKNGKR